MDTPDLNRHCLLTGEIIPDGDWHDRAHIPPQSMLIDSGITRRTFRGVRRTYESIVGKIQRQCFKSFIEALDSGFIRGQAIYQHKGRRVAGLAVKHAQFDMMLCENKSNIPLGELGNKLVCFKPDQDDYDSWAVLLYDGLLNVCYQVPRYAKVSHKTQGAGLCLQQLMGYEYGWISNSARNAQWLELRNHCEQRVFKAKVNAKTSGSACDVVQSEIFFGSTIHYTPTLIITTLWPRMYHSLPKVPVIVS